MRHPALCAVSAALAVMSAGCGGAGARAAHASTAARGSGPFVPAGGYASGPQSGLWGDTETGPDGDHIGCLAGRHYAFAVTLRNRSKEAVTLDAASGIDPAPRIIRRVAVQLRLGPPRQARDEAVVILRRWSAKPAGPVAVPPGRSAVVQSDFLLRHCEALAPGRTLVVPGSLVLSYRATGHTGRQTIDEQGARILLTRGPEKRECVPAAGSASLVASDVGCGIARRAAVACHPMSHGSWGTCSSGAASWDCGGSAGRGRPETCWLPRDKAHWFRVLWKS